LGDSATFDTGAGSAILHRIRALDDAGVTNTSRLPYSVRTILEALLRTCDGYEVTVANDGQAALHVLLAPNPPQIALLDWEMPRLDGIHVCWAVRSTPGNPYTYIIMVTAKADATDALAAFAAGVDDFLSKPIDSLQLLARLRCGERVLGLEQRSAERISQLKNASAEVRKLRSLLPICRYCKKVRDGADRWHEFEGFVHDNAGSEFSNVICPECLDKGFSRNLPEDAAVRA
jgi:CheY-like chemotaxis protein